MYVRDRALINIIYKIKTIMLIHKTIVFFNLYTHDND